MKHTTKLLAAMLLMSTICTAQSYIDMQLEPESSQIGAGVSVLFLNDAILDKGPYTGVQLNVDVPMGRNFVLGLRGDAYNKNVVVGELDKPDLTYEQTRRLYSIGSQLSLDPGDTGQGIYLGANLNYLWGDFKRTDPTDDTSTIQDTNGLLDNQLLTGIHAGVQANLGEKVGLNIQSDFDFAFNKLELPSTMSKVHVGLKFKF